jgi:DNA-binding NtrC family response regulator
MSAAGVAHAQSAFPLLVVSCDEEDHLSLGQILLQDCRLHRASSRSEAVWIAQQVDPWAVICDQTLADGDWRDLLEDFQRDQHAPPVIVSSHLPHERLWAEVFNLGGYDLLIKPFAAMEVSRLVKMAARSSNKGMPR